MQNGNTINVSIDTFDLLHFCCSDLHTFWLRTYACDVKSKGRSK